ncbi:hypothetical protein VYU27_005295 [Nannochloropsis oceanica]
MGDTTTISSNIAERREKVTISSKMGEEGGKRVGGAGTGVGGAGVEAGAEPAQSEAGTLGAIIMDASRPARLDALKSILSFLTPGEVQAFLEVGIGPEEQLVFEGLRQEVMQERLQQVFSDDPETQHKGLVELRRLVCSTINTPYECSAVIRAGFVPKIVSFLDDIQPRLQVEAAWLLTNLSSGSSEHTSIVVAHDAIPPLVRLLTSDNPEVGTQCAWALGNIAGDNTKHRDLVLAHGIIHPLLQTWTAQRDVASLRTTVWVLEVICDASWALRSLLSNRPGVGRSEMVERMCSVGIGNALLVAMINAASSGVRRHAEILVTKLTIGGYDRDAYPHSWSFYKKALIVLNMKAEHRLFKVRQYCAFATANLLAPISRKTEHVDDGPSPHAPSQVSDAVSLLLDHIYSPYPPPLPSEDAQEETNKTSEERQEERENLERQEKEVGEDLRLEAAWALKRILVEACRYNRDLAYQTSWAREGLLRVVRRLIQQAQATTGDDKKEKSGRSLTVKDKEWKEAEKQGRRNGRGDGHESDDNNSKVPAYEPRRHMGLVLALLECVDAYITAPFSLHQSSSPSFSAIPATTDSSTALHKADRGSHQGQNNGNVSDAEVNPAPVVAAAAKGMVAATATQKDMRNLRAVAQTLDRHFMGNKGARGSFLKASDDKAGREKGGASGGFARMMVPVFEALGGKFASTSVTQKLMVLQKKIDEFVMAVKNEEKQMTETK